MSVDWNGYEIYHPGVSAPLNTLSRAEARAAFDRLMDAKSVRIALLGSLLKANGIELGSEDSAVQELNDWFRENVEEDPASPGRLSADWYSVVNDIALFLGDVMIERHPTLRWEFFTWGKRNASFQRHVIMGFRTEDPKFHTNLDIDLSVATYGHRVVQGQDVERDAFVQWLKNVEARA